MTNEGFCPKVWWLPGVSCPLSDLHVLAVGPLGFKVTGNNSHDFVTKIVHSEEEQSPEQVPCYT